jgi:hypothetical protein
LHVTLEFFFRIPFSIARGESFVAIQAIIVASFGVQQCVAKNLMCSLPAGQGGSISFHASMPCSTMIYLEP